MKYYFYISSLKVDMLYYQLPTPLKKKVAAELKIDLKVLSTTLKSQATSETKLSKLELVNRALTKAGEVGDLTNPQEYFAGELDMSWGQPVLGGHSYNEKLVIFGGKLDQKLIGLVGSKAHMLGEEGTSVHAYYSNGDIIRVIADDLLGLSPYQIEEVKVNMNDAVRAYAGSQSRSQRVEFLAKTYLADTAPDYYSPYTDILFGSPLYVAMAKKPTVQEEDEYKDAWWRRKPGKLKGY